VILSGAAATGAKFGANGYKPRLSAPLWCRFALIGCAAQNPVLPAPHYALKKLFALFVFRMLLAERAVL